MQYKTTQTDEEAGKTKNLQIWYKTFNIHIFFTFCLYLNSFFLFTFCISLFAQIHFINCCKLQETENIKFSLKRVGVISLIQKII